jgi:type I restriction enzyme R subunit
MRILGPTNFAHLREHDEQLARLGMLAEKYFTDDPNTCLLKVRHFAELLAQLTAARVGLFVSAEESQYDLLRRLQDEGFLPREIPQLFGEVRRSGYAAKHPLNDDYRTALSMLKISWQMGLWFHRTFEDPSFQSGPFIPPITPKDESEELRTELDRLAKELERYESLHRDTTQQFEVSEVKLREAKDAQRFSGEMASETEQARAELETRLVAQQAAAAAQPKATFNKFVAAGNIAVKASSLTKLKHESS